MVRIRLRRAGAKNQPTHRIVAAEKEKPRDGRFIEILGDYNPRTEPSTIRVKEDRIYHWLSVGAQPTKSVKQIFKQIGLMERYERFRDGEDLETLLEESRKAQEERNIDPRTRRDEEVEKAVSKTKAEKAAPEEVVEETPVEETAQAEKVEEMDEAADEVEQEKANDEEEADDEEKADDEEEDADEEEADDEEEKD